MSVFSMPSLVADVDVQLVCVEAAVHPEILAMANWLAKWQTKK